MLNHAFPAGEGDTASAAFIIGHISHDRLHQFVGGHGLTYANERFGKAGIRAAQTVGAKFPVNDVAVVFIKFMRAGGAYRKTPAAAYAVFGKIFQYRI